MAPVQRTPLTIHKAAAEDIPSIMRIQELNLLSNLIKTMDAKALSERGFLVYRVRQERFERILSDPRGEIHIARRAGNVAGYALAYEAGLLLDEGLRTFDTAQIRRHCRAWWKLTKPRMLYVEQVALDAELSIHASDKLLRHFTREHSTRRRRKPIQPKERDLQMGGYNAIAAHMLDNPIRNMCEFRLYNRRKFELIGSQKFRPGEWGRLQAEFARLGLQSDEVPLWNVFARRFGSNGY